MLMAARRVVIFPNGQPSKPGQRETCSSYFIRHGGDVSRVIDGPFVNVRQCMDRVQRMAGITSGAECPIIIFAQSNPLALVLSARRTMEGGIPELRAATWVIFVDNDEDPFFESNARKLGTLGKTGLERTFEGPDGASFLILHAEAEQ